MDKNNENMKIIRWNMVLNSIKNIMGFLFPLITFPYITRVLGVENVGRFNFSKSVINYFVLIAGLGIGGYAIREGAKLRNDATGFRQLSNELFSINMISTIASYGLLLIFLIFVPKFHGYMDLLLILSAEILFKTIGIDWLYSIYEDYMYITIRTILFQFISLVIMFLFVKSEKDTAIYALATVISAAGSNLMNFIHSKKYCHMGLTLNIDWKRHLKPIFIFFATSATILIYVSSDTTILGFMCDDRTVGIYSVSTKVYFIIKTILSSIIVVSIPRLASLLGEKKSDEFQKVAQNVYGTILTFIFPAIIGLILLRKPLILLFAGKSYESATSSLFLLCIAMICCFGAYFWGQCIIVLMGLEDILFKATIVSALVNIVLNFILIPFWKENAAAFTTIIAEGITFFWCAYKGKKYVRIKGVGSIMAKILIGCLFIIFTDILISHIFTNLIAHIAFTMLLSIILYFVTEIVLRNEIITDILKGIIKKK